MAASGAARSSAAPAAESAAATAAPAPSLSCSDGGGGGDDSAPHGGNGGGGIGVAERRAAATSSAADSTAKPGSDTASMRGGRLQEAAKRGLDSRLLGVQRARPLLGGRRLEPREERLGELVGGLPMLSCCCGSMCVLMMNTL